MSRSLADRLRRKGGDDGFGLVEIMIAMTIFSIVAVAVTPLLIGGLKAGRTAQLNLQAKALGQERLERLRNLPFHVARQNGQYLDVLDIYYRDLVPVGAIATGDACKVRKYDAATATYSCTVANLGTPYAEFTQVVSAQFLKPDRSVVVPLASYDSQTQGRDTPVANLLGITVRTTWKQSGKEQAYVVRSHIANAQADPNAITTSLRTSALQMTSNLANGDILEFEGGLLSSEGALTTGSTASLSVVTARAELASGASARGASLSLTAPPAVVGGSPSDSNGYFLNGSGCDLACFGQTSVDGDQKVSVASGFPKVSLESSPVGAHLRRTGSNLFRGYSYSNAVGTEVDPALGLTGPMVSGGSGGTTDILDGWGWVDATRTGSTAVTTSGAVRLTALELFPTSFAPAGVVQVQVDQARLTCTSGGGAAAVTASWSGKVRWFDSVAGGYRELNLEAGAPALPDPSTLMVAPGVPLSTWVQAWSALTSAGSVNETTGRQAKGNISPVLSVLTVPTRAGDLTSPINIAVGTLACVAEDKR